MIFLKKQHILFFILIIKLSYPYSLTAEEAAGIQSFNILLWPERGGLVDSVTESLDIGESLNNAWFDAHIPTYTGMSRFQVIKTDHDSLEDYLDQIINLNPSCIEGDAVYIEQEVNRKERLYLPLLQIHFQPEKPPSLSGEIVFRSSAPQWEGILGLVHPAFGVGGRVQIDFWRGKTGKIPNWVAFNSTRELLRHLFAGSVQAAAIPQGSIENFLSELKRTDLLSQLVRIPVPQSVPACAIYLRTDLYQNPLYRTLISETWLRDHFPNLFQILSSAKPNY